jgi:hypothetical protein
MTTLLETLARERREREAWEAKTVPEGFNFTVAALREAFEAVQNADHWKNPVEAFVREGARNRTAEAVVFFTGSVARFEKAAEGWLRVTADGYYLAIGA